MNLKLLLLLSCLLLMMSACSNHTFAPALYHQDIAYQPKPASFDTAKTANYLSGGLNYYTDQTWSDLMVSGQLNYSRGHVFKNANLAYGVFGVAGDYERGSGGSAPDNFNDKFFGAAGARISANLFTTYERMDFRYIGFEMAYSHEFGAYSDFRNYVNSQPGFNVDTRTDLVTLGLTTEVIFHNQNNVNIEHGIRGFLGGTFGPNPLANTDYISSDLTPQFFRTIFPKVSYFINVKNFFGVAEIGSAIFIRAGYKF
ncbi:hypothetical protein ACPPVU_17600 [Mucilaginibacter sp. McL0603]|uniref:hypothetical protein n=1 Tax=Mucilaginibacter sp. McL0603 TaxID=3415670 RepID=UPI003CEF0243